MQEELRKMREVGQAVAYILKTLKGEIKAGMTGQDLAKRAEQLMKEKKVKSSIKGHLGFPGAICVSLNKEITHGVPDDRIFQAGDLVSLDVACHKKDKKGISHHADAALTVLLPSSEKNSQKEKLILVTKNALEKAIQALKPNQTTTSEIGKVIEDYVRGENYHVIREYGGHGIGNFMHQKPFIPNYPVPLADSSTIQENTAICIEPLVQTNHGEIQLASNNWTILAKGKELSAHFEHTVWIGKEKVEILTDYSE